MDDNKDTPAARDQQAIIVIVRTVQQDAFGDIASSLRRLDSTSPKDGSQKAKRVPKTSHLRGLDPFIDENGVLRVGGRLRRADLRYKEKHPALLPNNNHVASLVVRHFHQKIHHQGRQLTHGTSARR